MNVLETRKALDLSIYTSENVSTRLPRDVAALSKEAQSKADQMAIPFTYLVNLETGTVTCPEYDAHTDIRSFKTVTDEVPQICNFFLNPENYPDEEDTTLGFLWISGPDASYPDSRLGVGVGKKIAPNLVLVQNYSGLNTGLSSEQCLDLGYWASTFSTDKPFVRCNSIQELRDNPITFNCAEWSDPWEWTLVTILKDRPLYEYIISGEADRTYQERLTAAEGLAKIAIAGLATARTDWDYVYLGAFMEIGMMQEFNIVLDGQESGCGELNIDTLSKMNNTSLTSVPKFEKSTATLECIPIKCTACGWTPGGAQLAAIESGSITCCPDCQWIPGTDPISHKAKHSAAESITTSTTTQANVFYEATTTEPNYYQTYKTEHDTPWSISFFTPWLDPDLRSKYVVEESLVA